MITLEAARDIVAKAIANIDSGHDFCILNEQTIERDFGWVFFYTTCKYVATKDPQFLVPGTGPLVVLKADGAIVFLPTSLPPRMAIDAYEKQWKGADTP